MALRTRINVPITDEFVSEAKFNRYTVLQQQTSAQTLGRTGTVANPFGLTTQNHVDIRTFNPAAAQYTENWTNSTGFSFTTGTHPFLNNWNSLVSSIIGVTAFSSITTRALDLTQLGTSANVILALPNYPNVNINPDQTFLDFSSDGFVTTASVSFTQSTTALGVADQVATWPISLFTDTNMKAITSVRIRFNAYDQTTVMLAALRLVDLSWIQTNIDIDNWNGAIRQTIPANASRNIATPNNKTMPMLWWAAPTPGMDDPQPIDIGLGILFNTGSKINTNSFSVALRAIGGSDISQLALQGETQVQLNGPQPAYSTAVEIPRALSDIQGKTMSNLAGDSMLSLDARLTTVIESWLSYTITWGNAQGSVSIVRSDLPLQGYQWTGSNATVIQQLTPNTFYLCYISLTDVTTQLQIFALNQSNYAILPPSALSNPLVTSSAQTAQGLIFDTGPIKDSYQFYRRPGRIGWTANLLDGDAQIRAIRPHMVNYAEYRSVPLNSNTPVIGARLYTSFAPHEQLWTSWTPLSDGTNAPSLSADYSRFDPNHGDTQSTKITVSTPSTKAPYQGVISNILTPLDDPLSGIIDWANSQISFSLWFPSAAASGHPIAAYLLSQDGYQVPLVMPGISPNQWQEIVLNPPNLPPGYLTTLQSGRYQLVLTYSGAVATNFWVDNIQVIERTVTWDGRANISDPWITFGDLVNNDNAGALFANKGQALQIRGRAHRQDDVILSSPTVIPEYAPLGQLVWPENAGTDTGLPPDAFFVISQAGGNHYVTASATAPAWSAVTTYSIGQIVTLGGLPGPYYQSIVGGNLNHTPPDVTRWQQVALAPGDGIVDYFWSFGDGTVGWGQSLGHDYSQAGTYYVTLQITDNFGTQSSFTQSVSVS